MLNLLLKIKRNKKVFGPTKGEQFDFNRFNYKVPAKSPAKSDQKVHKNA